MDDSPFLLAGPSRSGAEWLQLRAGPLNLQFDPENLALRYLRLGEAEVIRSIYAAVRDRNWETIRPQATDLRVTSKADSFHIALKARCCQDGIDFQWEGTLSGDAFGTICFLFDGKALSTFLRARIGLCVLHPIEGCVGGPCRIEHVDGTVEESLFPRLVAPCQPFKNIRALFHTPAQGVQAEVRFEGDVFETEDQRNWTDPSFKTYSTPLALPFPVEVPRGMSIQQAVHVKLHGSPLSAESQPDEFATLTLSTTKSLPLPPLGLGIGSHGHPLTDSEQQKLKRLQLSHLHADLRLADPGWTGALERATTQAKQLGAGLHLALHLTDDAERELESLLLQMRSSPPPVVLWIIFHVQEKSTSAQWIRLAQSKLALFDPAIPLAAGADAYLAELNRNPPAPDSPALPCFSINPQVHAFDTPSLIENLRGQSDCLETAWELTHRPVVISPVTLRPRFNPNATGQPRAPAPGELPSEVDVRQMSLLAAVWTLSSVAELSRSGHAHSLTYYETTGWRGVMETEAGSPLPALFPSRPGMVFPVYHLLASMAGFSRQCWIQASRPWSVAALALLDERQRIRILIGNLKAEPQTIRLRLNTEHASLRMLDSRNAAQAVLDPEQHLSSPGQKLMAEAGVFTQSLPAFGLAQLDSQPGTS